MQVQPDWNPQRHGHGRAGVSRTSNVNRKQCLQTLMTKLQFSELKCSFRKVVEKLLNVCSHKVYKIERHFKTQIWSKYPQTLISLPQTACSSESSLLRLLRPLQQGVQFALQRLKEGAWLNIFPESRVNEDPVHTPLLPLKWGLGRLANDCNNSNAQTPLIILPIYHLGMDSVLPMQRPYVPRFGKRVTVVIGQPIEWRQAIKNSDDKTEQDTWKAITDLVEYSLLRLRIEAEIHHARFTYTAS